VCGSGTWSFRSKLGGVEIPDVNYPRSGHVVFVRGTLADRGVDELKGVPGEWRLYAVRDA
jgi:hypothetical protein